MAPSRITHNLEQCGGKPCIRGMRIRVRDVLELYTAGLSSEQMLADYPDLEPEIFCRARAAGAAVMSKVLDFSASGLPNSPGLCSPGQRRR
jgi:uncharacterized protein (DUF433 family)